MSRILADAKPAPPRVGCVLLRYRLGARGRDAYLGAHVGSGRSAGEPPAPLLLIPIERRRLEEELRTIAGELTSGAGVPEGESACVFFVDSTEKERLYGGPEGWARCVKGFLNARGFVATVAVAPSRAEALALARTRWGAVVVHEGPGTPAPSFDPRNPRETTAVGLRAAVAPPHRAVEAYRGPVPAAANQTSVGTVAAVGPGQLTLPGLKLGKPKRTRAR